MIRLKRAYDPPAASDGHRVLVDRLWPRGVRKAGAHIDDWAKAVAPSDELRKWFGHDPERFDEFAARYRRELHEEPARTALAELARRAARGPVTLVYAARDDEHNNAIVLAQELARGSRRAAPRRTARPRHRRS
jgi:uncharacterized protein YeaO (DUF488 family)